MDKSKENALMNCSSLDELLDVEFGKVGSDTREEFDRETEAFCLAQTLKEERKRNRKQKENYGGHMLP